MMDTYNHGYSKAMLDIQEWFKEHSMALKQNHLYNEKGVNKILAALVKYRHTLRETGTVNLGIKKEDKTIYKIP